MVSSPTSSLKLAKQATGDNLNTHGVVLNEQVIDLIDEAVAQQATISLTGNYPLTSTNYVTNESRQSYLIFTDGGLSGVPTVTAPSIEKWWWIKNAGSTYAITFGVSGGTSVSIPAGRTVAVFSDGTDCEMVDYVADTAANAAAASASETAAAASATAAATSATNAATSETNAAASAATAVNAAASAVGDPAELMENVTLDMVMTSPGGLVDPDTYFAAASERRYYDSQGVLQTAAVDEPRFDHDPATGEARGLLIEGASTNLLTYSEQFDNAAWTKSGATISANATTAPDGEATADKIVDSASSSDHYIRQASAASGSTTYTYSVFAEAAELSALLLSISTNNSGSGLKFALFDLANGTATDINAGSGNFGIVPCKDGRYRCWIKNETASGATTIDGRVYTYNAGTYSGATSYTGDGTSGLYIWGAQLEAQSFASSYIKTEASTVTRSADVYSITDMSWYDQDGGTIYCEVEFSNTAQFNTVWSLSDGGFNDLIRYIQWNSGPIDLPIDVTTGGVVQTSATGIGQTGFVKQAAAFLDDDLSAFKTGASVMTDTSATLPNVTQLVIGATNNAYHLNGHIKRLIYSKTRVPNATLEAITS